MMLLRYNGVWDFTPEQRDEYNRVRIPAAIEYLRATAQAIRRIVVNPFRNPEPGSPEDTLRAKMRELTEGTHDPE